jgi:hypothetical protein
MSTTAVNPAMTPLRDTSNGEVEGRPEALDKRRGRTLSSRTRCDTTNSHGPLKRLLGGLGGRRLLTSSG